MPSQEKLAEFVAWSQKNITGDEKLAFVFNRLTWRGVDRSTAQRFTLQMLVPLFAEDIGLLEQYSVGQ